ncbi:MAG: marine proteobacterial sortase target protein [Pseudomonadota bacterium]
MTRVLVLLTLLFAIAAGGSATSQTVEAPAAQPALMTLDDIRSGQLMLRSDRPGAFVPAPLVSTQVEVAVSGTIARATVTQRFTNPSDAWVEGIYAFPLPPDSAVDRLRMRIGDRFIEGQIKERVEAKQIYEEAKAEGKKAALFEQERPNLFTNSVANIGPGESVVAQISFQQSLARKDGAWELRMPLVAAPRYNPEPVVQAVNFGAEGWAVTDPVPDRDRVEAPIADPRREEPGSIRNPVELSVDLAPGFPIARLKSPFHQITVEEPEEGRAVIALTGPVPADRDFVLRWEAEGSAPQAALFGETVDGRPHRMLMLTAPDLGPATERMPREVIFVQDVSGSMSGASIEQARAGLEMALRRLSPEDRFNLVIFNNEFGVYSEDAVQATPEEIERAVGAVRGLIAEGGTEMLPALDFALDGTTEPGRLRQVIFLTDGAVGNEAQMLALIDRKLGDTRLFTVGIGSAPNSYFMTRAAEKGRGAHVYIGDLSEVAARMGELFTKIESPAITDISLSLPGGAETEVYPAPLPDLYAGEPLTIALRGTEEGTLRLSGTRSGQPWEVTLELGQAAGREGVAKLWARRKIASLEALRLSPAVVSTDLGQINVALLKTALDYGLVSRLTSLVAVDVTPSRPVGEALASAEVPLNLPAGWDPDAFLFEAPAAPPALDRAMLERIAPQGTVEATRAVTLPAGALNWKQSLVLALLLVLTGCLTLVVSRGRRRLARVRR